MQENNQEKVVSFVKAEKHQLYQVPLMLFSFLVAPVRFSRQLEGRTLNRKYIFLYRCMYIFWKIQR